jgi:tRNA G46 methylase TrmB
MSFTPAKTITSSQVDIHNNLSVIVQKHLKSHFLKPIADHTQKAFDKAHDYWLQLGRPKIVMDSACGTAESTRFLSSQYKESLVIGLDQSSKRLMNSNNQSLPENMLLLRCDCTDFWRLAEQADWRCEKHFLLYPNPYPKPQHIQRRWHGHPTFSSLLSISESIELRTNWEIYAREFTEALIFSGRKATLSIYQPEQAITAFERKYQLYGSET